MFFVLQVVSVNPADKVVKLSDGILQQYDQLLISTGCRSESSSPCCSSFLLENRRLWFPQQPNSPDCVHRARPLSCPGCGLQGVKLLQNHDDAKEIHNSCLGRKAVVIGASFIGDYNIWFLHIAQKVACCFLFCIDYQVEMMLLLDGGCVNRTLGAPGRGGGLGGLMSTKPTSPKPHETHNAKPHYSNLQTIIEYQNYK